MSDNLPTKFDADMRHRFLQYYALTGQLVKSSREIGISPTTVRTLRKNDPAFDEAMQEAADEFRESIEREVLRRAVFGVDEPVFQGGEEVGTKRVYSDALLMMAMKKFDPSYKETHQVDVNVSPGVLAVPMTESEEDWEKRNAVEADYDTIDEQPCSEINESEEPDAEE